jgi:hypothetical protein
MKLAWMIAKGPNLAADLIDVAEAKDEDGVDRIRRKFFDANQTNSRFWCD